MSSYGDQKLYLYDNVIELVVTVDNIYVDNRPMNLRKLVAHKGITNTILFNIRDRDRRLQNVFSDILRVYMIHPTTKRRIFTKPLVSTSDVGKVKLILEEADLANIESGLYTLYVTRSTQENENLPVYNDQNNNIRFDIEITDQTGEEPVSTQVETTFTQTANTMLGDASNVIVSSAFYGNLERNFPNAQHSIAFYTTQYTGNITIQASCLLGVPDIDDASSDWFNIETIALSNSSVVTHHTFTVNCNWVRVTHTPNNTNGTLNKILLRN
jgi:hypothetical protein